MEKLIPLIVIHDLADTEKILGGLKKRGLNTAEITFRTDCAEQAIKLGTEKFPDMCIGAGTVINAEQCKRALKAGSKFIVSPGLDVGVAEICAKNNIPYYPGCVTPTEIMQALSLRLTTLKFFPASVYGGIKALKALKGPFPQVKFIPTGGVNNDNLDEYMALDNVAAVGGSFLAEGL